MTKPATPLDGALPPVIDTAAAQAAARASAKAGFPPAPAHQASIDAAPSPAPEPTKPVATTAPPAKAGK